MLRPASSVSRVTVGSAPDSLLLRPKKHLLPATTEPEVPSIRILSLTGCSHAVSGDPPSDHHYLSHPLPSHLSISHPGLWPFHYDATFPPTWFRIFSPSSLLRSVSPCSRLGAGPPRPPRAILRDHPRHPPSRVSPPPLPSPVAPVLVLHTREGVAAFSSLLALVPTQVVPLFVFLRRA